MLPATEDAGRSYLDETLFIGDSNTVRYTMYADATSYIKTYLQGLQAIQTAWPYCDIIVSAIPPLDKQRENTNLTMTQVDAYNAALVTMCEENGFKFLNSAEVLRDAATGWAKTDYTLSDGVHLSKTAVTAYFDYVRTHAYITEDRRPQPLGSIPQPDGVPANLITSDPIAVRGAKVPLEFVAANGGKVSGSTSQLVKKGGTASAVTAVADEGFVFAGWTASSGGSYSNATISFTMPQNADAGGVVLTAHFKADAHEHEYVEVEGTKTAATCLKAGSAKYKCKICGEVIEKDIKPLGHDWDDGVQKGAEIIYTCKREGCGETKVEAAKATPTPSPTPQPTATPVVTTAPTAVPTQAPTPVPTAVPTAAPTAVPATPEPTAVPTPTPEPHTHDFQLISDTTTCTAAGTKTYQCSCGETKTEEFAALGHSGVEQSDGSVVCSRCNAVLQPAPVPEPVTPSEPTTESDTPTE